MIIGNKVDLGLSFPPDWGRIFSRYIAASHGFLSAKTGEDVGRGFEMLARQAMKHASVGLA